MRKIGKVDVEKSTFMDLLKIWMHVYIILYCEIHLHVANIDVNQSL